MARGTRGMVSLEIAVLMSVVLVIATVSLHHLRGVYRQPAEAWGGVGRVIQATAS
ncbi:MAG: hypothetical protein ACO2PN_27000 [Pyrobaculum sp.]|jgi:hypothetical protein